MEHKIVNYALTAVISETGGELISLTDRSGREYIWQGDKSSWGGHSPVLFPICGSLRNDQTHLANGKETHLSRHGFARKLPFVCELTGDGRALFHLTGNEATLKQYPYRFSLSIQYELLEKAIRITYNVTNSDQEEMPFFIGGHPGFNCPIDAGSRFEDYVVAFEHEETCTIPKPLTENGLIDITSRRELLNKDKMLPLTHELFDQDAIIFDHLNSRRVRLIHKDNDHGVELEFADFPYLILWSANHADFIAVEPWSGLSTCNDENDQFEAKRNVMILPPGQSRSYSYTISIL